MRADRRISYTTIFIAILLLSLSLSAADIHPVLGSSAASLSAISFVSNIETIGVTVSGTTLPAQGDLYYRQSGAADWRPAHPLLRIGDGRLVGSLFGLSAGTSYDVRVVADSSEITGSASTQPDQLSFTPGTILHVDDNASPGGDGSTAAPYQTIQEAVNHAGPGTQVLVADGTYREAVTFPGSGTAGKWIQIKAEGNAAVLDSADRLSGNIWTLTSTSKVWFAKVNGPVAYLARSGTRFYQYDDLNGLKQAKGHGGVTINEGWFYEASTSRLYIRSLDTPSAHLWQLPRLNHAFDVAARDWIWIEGFEIRFYGTTTNGCGVCTLNSSHLVIRRNKIHNMQLGIFVNWNGTSAQGNDTRIEGNEIYDPGIYAWPWAALKASYMEGTGIIVRGHIGAIVRENTVHSYFNGIYVGSSGALENSELAFDGDIYNNYMYNISDDGLEPEGACINQRFRNNIVDKSFIGISIAPVTQGPTWVFRNIFSGFTGRAIKFADDSDGIVLIYHNTSWTTVGNVNGADLITAVHNVTMRNNIFQSSGYSINEVPTGSTANSWDHDNWYTTRGSTGPHFRWENVNYNTVSALCKASGLECNGYEDLPGFANPPGGDFALQASSPNIDRGVLIPGINDDFTGSAPDAGAYEFAAGSPAPLVLSSTRVNSNPTGAEQINFTITFSVPVTGVDANDFVLTTSGVTGALITNVSGSAATYAVTVKTGSGNGTIRLDVVDNDSIKDVAHTPLGGFGIGNGNFTAGETYTVTQGANISIGIQFIENYPVLQNPPTIVHKPNIADGPVQVTSARGGNLFASERVIAGTSFNELMGYPTNQLTTEYWFPWYDNVSMSTWIVVGNPSGSQTAAVDIYVGNSKTSYSIPPKGWINPRYDGIVAGPVRVKSTNGANFLPSERALYNGSFNEVMGYPTNQLTTEYWFPWYDNISMAAWILVGNPTGSTADVSISIGTARYNYTVPAGGRITPRFAGVQNGPVRVRSTNGVKIFASERSLYGNSFNEVMGFPSNQFTTEYWYPWYDNVSMANWVLVGNPTGSAANVDVYIGTSRYSYTIPAGGRITPRYTGKNVGPVRVRSTNGVKIFSSQRVVYGLSFNEVMGYPGNQLTTEYWFPWYESTSMSTDILVGAP